MSVEVVSILTLIGGIALLIISSFVLTTTIEDIGKRARFTHSFTGAIISPLFTSLPELGVILAALVTLSPDSGSQIAAGVIIGEPFMVSAIGFPAMAMTLLLASRKTSAPEIDRVMPLTLIILGLAFPLMLIPIFFNFLPVRISTVILLLAIYVLLIHYYRTRSVNMEEETPLVINNKGVLVILTIAGIIAMIVASVLLVRSVHSIAQEARINDQLISILIVPIGTIVPETLNSIVWASKRKTNLAMGAITGEEALFVTVYPALGIAASPWLINQDGFTAIIIGSVFFILMGLATYSFRRSSYLYILWPIALLLYLLVLLY